MNEHIHIVCTHCDAVNRLPADKLEAAANCGKCKHPLLDGKVQILGNASFDHQVGWNDLPVVIDFWAPWCGPCKMMAPAFEKVAHELRTKARFAKVNTEGEQALAQRFGIRSIPTLMIFKDGREFRRQAGAMDPASLKQWIESA